MLNIQEYVSCFKDVRQAIPYLRQKFAVVCEEQTIISVSDGTWWPAYYFHPGLHADEKNPITKESNGLILDEDGDLVAKSFDLPIEIDDVKDIPSDFDYEWCHAQEMTDGIRIIVYNHEGEWFIASPGSVTGDEQVAVKRSLSYNAMVALHMVKNGDYVHWTKPFENTDPRFCFVFDFIHQWNYRIAPVHSNSLVLLTIINVETGKELPQPRSDSFANQWKLRRPKGQKLGVVTLDYILSQMDPFSKGAMLIDEEGRRVKINNPIYYTIRNAIQAGDIIKPTHVAKIVQACRDQLDLIRVAKEYPQYQHAISFMMQIRDALHKELTILWQEAEKHKDDAKTFADVVKDHPLNALMFLKKDGRADSIRDWLHNMDAQRLIKHVRGRDEKEFDAIERNLKIGNVLGGLEHGGSTNQDS